MKKKIIVSFMLALAFIPGVHAQQAALVEDINNHISKSTELDSRIFQLENIATTEDLKTMRFMKDGKVQLLVQAPQIHYDEGVSSLDPREYKRLQPIAEVVKGNPLRVIVAGYSDNSNTEVMYDSVSEDRAMEVANYLIQRGVEPQKITVVGRGPADPIGDNSTREGRKKNRRVEITVFSTL